MDKEELSKYLAKLERRRKGFGGGAQQKTTHRTRPQSRQGSKGQESGRA